MTRRLILVFVLFNSFSLNGQELYFPPVDDENWDTVSPASLDWCDASVNELYEYLDSNGTKSFLILKDGKIVIEKYFGDHHKNKQWTWFSAGKSLRGFLIGIAQQNGFLNINDKTSDYLGAGWSSADAESESRITIKTQLSMTSGLDERFFDCITPACLFKRADPETRWAYHNGPYNLLKDVLESATNTEINDFTKNEVRNLIGMQTGTWLANGNNTFFISTARDMARFGLLIQNDGSWDNTSLLTDADYFAEMVNSSQDLNPSYGYLWWLNGKDSYIAPSSPISISGSIAPNAPEDLITAAGAQGQFISISKSTGFMMIRQGISDDSSLAALPLLDEIWQKISSLNADACGTITTTNNIEQNDILVYPNPATGLVNISGIKHNSHFNTSLIDASGKILLVTDRATEIDVSDFEKGNYFLKVIIDERVYIRKLIIQ